MDGRALQDCINEGNHLSVCDNDGFCIHCGYSDHSKTGFLVTLMLFIDKDEYDHPDEWAWSDLLDMDYDDVILEDVREIRNL